MTRPKLYWQLLTFLYHWYRAAKENRLFPDENYGKAR